MAAAALVDILACPDTGQGVRNSERDDRLMRLDEKAQFPVVEGVPVLVPDATDAVLAFRADRLERLAEIESWHFWFGARLTLVEELLKRHLPESALVLDLGCGSGKVLDVLARQGHRPIGLDARPEGLARVRARLPGAWLVRGHAHRLPFKDGALDAVVTLDVLEHVDDRVVLEEIARVLRPAGTVVATVPAAPWLWSYRDDDAGHLRRYSRKRLEHVFRGAGFEPREIRYYQSLLFPLVAVSRLAGRRRRTLRDAEERPPALVNHALAGVNALEVRLGRRVRWPWGSSLLAVARKSA